MFEGTFVALKNYGWAGFFAFQYLVTVWFLIRLLVKDRTALLESMKGERERTERIATIIEKSAESDKRLIEAVQGLKVAVYADLKMQSEAMAYYKGRDDQGRRQ
jgi:hypothetical protein